MKMMQALRETAGRLRNCMQTRELHLHRSEARWVDYEGRSVRGITLRVFAVLSVRYLEYVFVEL